MIAFSSSHHRAYCTGLFVVLIGMILACPLRAAADEGVLQVHGVTQQDLDGDDQPDLTIINCSFATNQDTVYVYDGAQDMIWSDDWTDTTDFGNDTWVFDVEANGDAQLIIVFSTSGNLATAHIYDDRNDDGHVAFENSGSKIQITESPHWTVQMTSDQGWWLPDGSVNSGMEISIDGVIELDRLSAAGGLSAWFQSVVLNDGTKDRIIEAVDEDNNGIAEYVLERVVAPSVPGGVFSARLYVNSREHQPRQYDEHVFWPFLVGTHRYEGYRYFDHPPAISVLWSSAKVDRAGLMGYPIEEGYHINSYAPWTKGSINYANFENPMAYYDLAQDSDGDPELFVRLETYGPNDRRVSAVGFAEPLVEAEYAWDQDNSDMTFDYQLSLIGRHPVESVVSFPDFAVRVVPYDNVPQWVTEQTWDVAVFTVAEDGGRRGSEGMYSWLVALGMKDGTRIDSGIKSQYVTGIMNEAPTEAYSEIDQGRRGEISYSFFSQPFLYFSPVDRKLHLPGIDYGLWNVDGVTRIEYADLQSDGFVDQWKLVAGDELQSILIESSGFLVYADDTVLHLKRVDLPKMLFSTIPPRNHQEWLQLDEQLRAHGSDLVSTDLRAMIEQFDGPSTEIRGASMRDFRSIRNGFRFILQLQPGFRLVKDHENIGAFLEASGSYLVSYDNSEYSVRPLTPPSLQVDDFQIGSPDGALRELDWTYIDAKILNRGLEDMHDTIFVALLEGPEGQHEVLTTTVALVPGEGTERVIWDWLPRAPGQWKLRIEIESESTESSRALPQDVLSTSFAVEAKTIQQPNQLLAPGIFVGLPLASFLASFVVLAGGTVSLWVKNREQDRPEPRGSEQEGELTITNDSFE